jgi:EAL and modified HD-GYP domain-containing signal transduction protein
MDVFVARQPIFDRTQKVFAYQLLFRTGFDNLYFDLHGDEASSRVISDSFLLIGLDKLTCGKKAIINFTPNLILQQIAAGLPKQHLIISLLEDVTPDQRIIDACKNLKRNGYSFIFSDFVLQDRYAALQSIPDIIRINFNTLATPERKMMVQKFITRNVKILVEEIGTSWDYQEALAMGCSYFQGIFFSKPEILTGKDIPGYKLNYLRMLQEVNKEEIDFDSIENIVKQDVSLTFKLLKYINSAAFGLKTQIQSIKQALMLLGLREIKKLLSLISLTGIGRDKPAELLTLCITRAKLCELLAARISLKQRASDLFLMGMFSLIDVLMDRPLPDIINDLPISPDIKTALLGGQNLFRDVLETVVAYEKGDWPTFTQYAQKLKLTEQEFPQLYLSAIGWAYQIYAQ